MSLVLLDQSRSSAGSAMGINFRCCNIVCANQFYSGRKRQTKTATFFLSQQRNLSNFPNNPTWSLGRAKPNWGLVEISVEFPQGEDPKILIRFACKKTLKMQTMASKGFLGVHSGVSANHINGKREPLGSAQARQTQPSMKLVQNGAAQREKRLDLRQRRHRCTWGGSTSKAQPLPAPAKAHIAWLAMRSLAPTESGSSTQNRQDTDFPFGWWPFGMGIWLRQKKKLHKPHDSAMRFFVFFCGFFCFPSSPSCEHFSKSHRSSSFSPSWFNKKPIIWNFGVVIDRRPVQVKKGNLALFFRCI